MKHYADNYLYTKVICFHEVHFLTTSIFLCNCLSIKQSNTHKDITGSAPSSKMSAAPDFCKYCSKLMRVIDNHHDVSHPIQKSRDLGNHSPILRRVKKIFCCEQDFSEKKPLADKFQEQQITATHRECAAYKSIICKH